MGYQLCLSNMPKVEPKCVLELSKEFGLFCKQAFPFLNTKVIDIFHLQEYYNVLNKNNEKLISENARRRPGPWASDGNGSGLKIVWN